MPLVMLVLSLPSYDDDRSTKLSICSAYGGMQMSYKYLFDTFLNILEKYKKGEGEGIRWIINVDKDSLMKFQSFFNY